MGAWASRPHLYNICGHTGRNARGPGYSTTEIAVEAMNEGAYDFVPKPFDNNELCATITKALELLTLDQEKAYRSTELKSHLHFNRIISNSPGMQAIYQRIRQIGPTKNQCAHQR